jgi:hypothetical protein
MSLKAREEAAKSGQLPHEFLLSVARGEEVDGYRPTFAERMDAAKVAAPYYAPRLGTLHVEMEQQGPTELAVPDGDLSTMPRPDLYRAVIATLSRRPAAWAEFTADEGVRAAIDRLSRRPLPAE